LDWSYSRKHLSRTILIFEGYTELVEILEEKADDLPRSFYIVSMASLLFQLARHTTQPIFSLYVLEMGASLLQLGSSPSSPSSW
jgi:hypothetical protein